MIMDLVASYSSDESENVTNTQLLPGTSSIKTSSIDTANIDSSDSEVNALNIHSRFKQYINEKCCAEYSVTNKNIEHINISDSDSENDVQTLFNKTHPNQIVHQPSNVNSEKIDFLNLESSDTDDEQQNFQASVDNLLCSAAILNDIEYGPVKPVMDMNQMHATSSTESFIHEPSPKCQSRTDFIPCGKRADKISDALPRKHFKSDTDRADINELDAISDEEKRVPKEFIFREDDRVMAMYNKKFCRIPTKITKDYVAHTSAINILSWCVPQYSHLLLSASIDCSLKVWDIFSNNPVQCFKSSAGLKAAQWMHSGKQIATGGYGKKAHVFDVASGKEIIQYDVDNYLTSLEVHPKIEDVILCGTKNAILVFDMRVNFPEPVKTFTSNCDEVLDIVFLGESEFACSTNVVTHDSADRTIMVWDFSSGALFSNQVFLERYTCPSLKVHPSEPTFVAQTNGDYIAFFSTRRPYKIKNKRCMGHKVSGFGIECDISSDGKYLVSGDANGDIYFYDFTTSNPIHKLTAKSEVATNRLKWHPVLFSTMATATWDGCIQIWK